MGLRPRGLACLITIALISAGVLASPARAQSAPDDPGLEFQWGLTQVAAQEAWSIGRGRGTIVAVLDTGVDLAHEDLDGRIAAGGRDFTNDDAVPQDDNGQGTHLAGIIAASTNNGTGVAGIAHASKILPVKVLDDEDEGFESHVIQGIRFAIEKKVDVLVLDLDGDITLVDGGAQFRDAIEDAWAAGIVPVVSAEHSYVRSNDFAEAPALVVGGVTTEGAAGSYNDGVGSARWGISAPGGTRDGGEGDIFSTFFPHREESLTGTREYGRYVYDGGNAQAAAHVAGAAAILRGLGQTPAQTVQRILSGAADKGPNGRDRTFGAGLLHIGQAVEGLSPSEEPAQVEGAVTTAPPTTTSGGSTSPSAGNPGPAANAGPPAASGSGGFIGTPAGADEPAGPASPSADGEAPDDIIGGLALNEGEPMPGRTPVLPLVALLLLMGSATITWALRRRSGEPGEAPLNF